MDAILGDHFDAKKFVFWPVGQRDFRERTEINILMPPLKEFSHPLM